MWDFVVETAFRFRAVMEQDDLRPWSKLTGAKGLHVMASLAAPLTHGHAHSYTRHIVQRLAHADQQRYVTSAAPEKRAGYIFVRKRTDNREETS